MRCKTVIMIAGLMVLGTAATSPGLGAQATWAESAASRVRLVAGGDLDEGLLAGIQIRVDPGWKTYWRMPGDAGVPPAFEWSASVNADRVEIEWPAPSRYVDPWATTIGYVGEVVFPVVVTPTDPSRPVFLRLELTYAVCSDICVPGFSLASSNILLMFPPVPTAVTFPYSRFTLVVTHRCMSCHITGLSVCSSTRTEPTLNDLVFIFLPATYKFNSVLPPPTSM